MSALLLTIVLASVVADEVADQCTPDALLEDARAAFARGSPELKAYLRAVLENAALSTPNDLLLKQLEREDDPALVEALGAAIAKKAETTDDPTLAAPLLRRALQDSDPARRAAAVRALRGTGSVELMRGAGADVDYARLIRDEDPGVRAAVVENLVVEDEEVYSGHSGDFAEAALQVADTTTDAAAAARIVRETSTEQVGPERARALGRALDDDDADMRGAAARALGGLQPAHADDAVDALVARYRSESSLEVRREILASIARLLRAGAVPVLRSLRDVDARLQAEIDAWIQVLQRGLPEWQLVLREKDRR